MNCKHMPNAQPRTVTLVAGPPQCPWCEVERLQEWMRCIHDLLDEEIGVRFRTSSHRTEEEVGKNSRVYALLAPFRNMARSAINGEPYLKPVHGQSTSETK